MGTTRRLRKLVKKWAKNPAIHDYIFALKLEQDRNRNEAWGKQAQKDMDDQKKNWVYPTDIKLSVRPYHIEENIAKWDWSKK